MKCNVKELQDHLLEVMVAFHQVCLDHNLKYYLVGGSQLGAIRHEGFIPWDDDIDVAMSRYDYDKLLALPSKVWPENLRLNTPYKTEYYIIPFTKLVDTNTTLVEDGVAGCLTGGIYVDIFPLDGAGSRFFYARYKYFIFQIKRRLILYKVKNSKDKSLIDKFMTFYTKNRSGLKMFKSLEAWMKKTDYNKSKIIGNYAGAWGLKEFMDKDILGEPKLYKFEQYQFYGVEDYDTYLTNLYGDYMQLPPKDKQKSHHGVVYLDLSTSYLDNKDGDQIEK